jgi:predicted ABC-type transport system involved in lysophospholipase L1 biosynthesis ATPase subunit
MPEPLLALEAVTLAAHDGRTVFQDLDWRLERGGRHRLLGGAGSGCTALLRLCAGLIEPDAGRVVLDGVPVERYRPHPFVARGDLGFVPSDGGLAVNLTLLENLALPLRFARNQDRAGAERTALALLEEAGLASRARQRPREPGDREAWLVSVLRAAARRPRLWLVDRPIGGMDAATLQAAQAVLGRAAEDPDVAMLIVGGEWMAGLDRELQVAGGRLQAGRQP